MSPLGRVGLGLSFDASGDRGVLSLANKLLWRGSGLLVARSANPFQLSVRLRLLCASQLVNLI